jgi:hypothetical protein
MGSCGFGSDSASIIRDYATDRDRYRGTITFTVTVRLAESPIDLTVWILEITLRYVTNHP